MNRAVLLCVGKALLFLGLQPRIHSAHSFAIYHGFLIETFAGVDKLFRMKRVRHIPALRLGKAYESLERTEVKDFRNGELKGEVSQVNAGVIRKDLQRLLEARRALKKFPTDQLLEMCARAGEQFLNGTLRIGEHKQTAQEYVETLSVTSGLPYVTVRRNMARIHQALVNMRAIVKGLTRGFDFSVLDEGLGEQDGVPLSFFPPRTVWVWLCRATRLR